MRPPKTYNERIRDAAADALAAHRDGCTYQATRGVEKIRCIEAEESQEQLNKLLVGWGDTQALASERRDIVVKLLKTIYSQGAPE